MLVGILRPEDGLFDGLCKDEELGKEVGYELDEILGLREGKELGEVVG